MKNIWRVVQLIPEYRGRVVSVVLVGVLVGAIGAATPYIYKHIVDIIARLLSQKLNTEEAALAVTYSLAIFAAFRAALVFLNFMQEKQADDLWLDTVSMLRQRVFDNMTGLSIDYYEKTRVGEIMDRFGNITQINMWLRQITEGALSNILQMFFIVAMLLVKAPVVGAIMLLVVPFNLLDSYRNLQQTRPYRRGWERLAGRLAGLLAEMVSNISTVRSFGGEPAVKQRYDETQKEWKVQRGTLHILEWKSNLTRNFINGLATVASVILVSKGALAGHYTPGDILLVLTLSQNLITTIAPITRLINQTGDIETNAERLMELLDVQSDVTDVPNASDLQSVESLEFDNVSFAYPEKNNPVLRNISFCLRAGETLALVGQSGSGKTTIIKLLMRFYDPTSGRVLINGRDIRFYTQRSLRAQMGVVLQDVALFNDSIEENIAFARRDANAEAVREAAITSHAETFIRRLPEGYETLVGERGIKLSGGEKQRVAIARAILKDPQLIILDEATSALDSESEHLVQEGLQKLMCGRTSVVIAHRLSTVMSADQILVMRAGQVIEQGDHAKLVSKEGGLYARLYQLQVEGQLHGEASLRVNESVPATLVGSIG